MDHLEDDSPQPEPEPASHRKFIGREDIQNAKTAFIIAFFSAMGTAAFFVASNFLSSRNGGGKPDA